jgi:predicted RNA-binding Zn-ribbon protein involved in translation (DUF1610 family)
MGDYIKIIVKTFKQFIYCPNCGTQLYLGINPNGEDRIVSFTCQKCKQDIILEYNLPQTNLIDFLPNEEMGINNAINHFKTHYKYAKKPVKSHGLINDHRLLLFQELLFLSESIKRELESLKNQSK